MSTKTSPCFSPDGNGGIYKALLTQGVLKDMQEKGIEHIHCYCVDNCLVKVGDPFFIGYCALNNCDVGAKCIEKIKPEEQVGLIVKKDGKPAVVEYSEIGSELSTLQRDGKLVYNCGNIANHYYSLEFLKKVQEFELSYHVAKKKIANLGEDGKMIVPSENNGIKLELFIFDVFPFTKNFKVLMVPREDEFSALKNKEGNDSPMTSRRDILNKHKRWLEKVGAIVVGDVEVSPLLSYDGEGLEKFNGRQVSGVLDQ